MADTCRFFEHDNIANFSDQIILDLYFLPDKNNILLQKRFHTLQKEKLQLVKEKMKQVCL